MTTWTLDSLDAAIRARGWSWAVDDPTRWARWPRRLTAVITTDARLVVASGATPLEALTAAYEAACTEAGE